MTTTNAQRQKIYLLACCYNEAKLLPFFLDYYCNFIGVSKIFLYDGGSTDATAEIIKDYPVQMFVHKSEKIDDRQLMYFRNECYKQWRHECDWFIVCDIDEFLYNPDIHSVLRSYKAENITLPLVEGYEMLSKEFPVFKKGDYLPNYIQTGLPNPAYYNKHLIFDPVIDINYMLGCHQAQPTGPVKRSAKAEFKNLHHKVLSYEYFLAKAVQTRDRLSDWNKEVGAGFHYAHHAAKTQSEFLGYFIDADNVFESVNEKIKNDPLASFISDHLLADTEDYRLLDLSNWGRYPSNIRSTFDLLKRKFSGRHIFAEHPSGIINISALRSILNIGVPCNTVYLDAAMLNVENLSLTDATTTLLGILISQSSKNNLVVLLDLSAVSESAKADILASNLLTNKFDLYSMGAIVIGKLRGS